MKSLYNSCYKVIYNILLLKSSSSYRNLWLWPTDLLTFSSTGRCESMNLLLCLSPEVSTLLTFLICSLSSLLFFIIILSQYKLMSSWLPTLRPKLLSLLLRKEFPFCIWSSPSKWIRLGRDCMSSFLQWPENTAFLRKCLHHYIKRSCGTLFITPKMKMCRFQVWLCQKYLLFFYE